MITQQQILEHVAGHYLCMPLPSNWHDLDEDAQDKYLEENAWQPFEYHDGGTIARYMNDSRRSLEAFLKANKVDVEEE